MSSQAVTSGYRKRKLSYDSNEGRRHRIINPRFISANNITSIDSRLPSELENERAVSFSFESLPQELFCSVVGYLGPTSSTLCSLAQVTRCHRSMLKTIGDVMLPVAHARFRVPLPPKSECESSISLFVRHARISKDVHDHLAILEDCLKKDFPTPETFKDVTCAKVKNFVTADEVDHALDIALCLLGAGERSHHPSGFNLNNSHLAARIANSVGTTALEWRVSKLCAALGANAYKYAKTMMCETEADQINSHMHVTDEYSKEEDDFSISSSHSEDEDIYRLDRACMVMQLTIANDLEIARQVRLASGVTISYPK